MSSKNKSVSTGPNRTVEIATRVVSVGWEHLTADAVTVVKRLISDGIAVAIAGTREQAPKIYAEYVRETGCRADSTVWGFDFKTSPVHAAFANAVSMHVLDFEPMSSPPTHAVSPTVPVVMALAEARGKSGRDIITASAKGFEMQGRVLAASRHDRGSLPFHTPGVVGVMGSTAAASHLLGLDAGQLVNAFGIATSRCSGLSANTGSMVKCTHPGNAAGAGLEAALLAQKGFESHPNIFEAGRGYVDIFFHDHFDYDTVYAYGNPFRFVTPGMAIKFYPSKFPTHFVITAAIGLRRQIADPSKIKNLHLAVPDIEDADRPQPRSGLEGKFSLQYTSVIGLLDGKVGIDSFTDERRFRQDVVDLLAKTTIKRDPNVSRDTSNMSVELIATMEDGSVVRQVCDKPPGFWGQPVDPDLHGAKIRDCLSARLPAAAVDDVLAMLGKLEHASAADVSRLIGLLACRVG